MGNSMFYCILHPVSSVRVIKSDGEVFDFEHPLIAKQLMKAYPGHLVVHVSEVSRSTGPVLGHGSKVSMMRAEDTLLPGQTYCLLRVPTQAGKGLLPRPPTFKAAGQNPSSEKSGKKAILTLRGMLLGDRKDVQVSDGDVARVLKQQYINPPHTQPSGPWKPQLDAIIESPLNPTVPSRAHNVTMSPLARQAGYTPVSAATAGSLRARG